MYIRTEDRGDISMRASGNWKYRQIYAISNRAKFLRQAFVAFALLHKMSKYYED
jgi:hypothetical protein